MQYSHLLLTVAILASLIYQTEGFCCKEAWLTGSPCKGRGCNWFCCDCSYCNADYGGYTGLIEDTWQVVKDVAVIKAAKPVINGVWNFCKKYFNRHKRGIRGKRQYTYTYTYPTYTYTYPTYQVTYPITYTYPAGYYYVESDCDSYYRRKKREIDAKEISNTSHLHQNAQDINTTEANHNWRVHSVTVAIFYFRSVDKNHDGIISFHEFSKYRLNSTTEEFESMDKNGDLSIEPAEFDDTLETWPSNHTLFTVL